MEEEGEALDEDVMAVVAVGSAAFTPDPCLKLLIPDEGLFEEAEVTPSKESGRRRGLILLMSSGPFSRTGFREGFLCIPSENIENLFEGNFCC